MKPRKQIRQKVFDLIKDETDFGERVFLSRKVPLNHDEDESLDGSIIVFVEKETATVWNQSPKTYKKTLSVAVAVVKSLKPDDVESIEDQLETIAEQVQDILEENDTLDGLCSECDYQSSDPLSNTDGEYVEGAIKLTYSITYYEEVGKAEDDLDDFNTSNVSIKHNDHADFNFEVQHQE